MILLPNNQFLKLCFENLKTTEIFQNSFIQISESRVQEINLYFMVGFNHCVIEKLNIYENA